MTTTDGAGNRYRRANRSFGRVGLTAYRLLDDEVSAWQPYYDDGTVAIYHGDVEDLALDDLGECVAAVVTSRPTTSGSTTTTTRPATPSAGRPTAT